MTDGYLTTILIHRNKDVRYYKYSVFYIKQKKSVTSVQTASSTLPYTRKCPLVSSVGNDSAHNIKREGIVFPVNGKVKDYGGNNPMIQMPLKFP